MIARRLAWFFAVAFLISWLLWAPLWLPSLGIRFFDAVTYQHALGGLGPALAAIICIFLFKMPVLRTGRAFTTKGFLYLLISLLLPFILHFIILLVEPGWGNFSVEQMLVSAEYPQWSALQFFAYNFLFFGLGEEFGWRGFALPLLQARFSERNAALVLTVLWAAWHMPLFLYRPGYTSMDAAGIFGWIFSLLTGSVLLSFLYNRSGGSILVCAVFHTTVDIAFTSQQSGEKVVASLGAAITILGVLVFFLLKRKRHEEPGAL